MMTPTFDEMEHERLKNRTSFTFDQFKDAPLDILVRCFNLQKDYLGLTNLNEV